MSSKLQQPPQTDARGIQQVAQGALHCMRIRIGIAIHHSLKLSAQPCNLLFSHECNYRIQIR